MKIALTVIWSVIFSQITFGQQSGREIIAAAIKFHDPEGNWPKTAATFNFSDTRPGKDARSATLYLNNLSGTLCIMREQDGAAITRHVINNRCSYDINGNFNPSAEEIEKFSLNDKRSLMLRNYYLYLWGLPMKLNDPGTNIDPVVYDKSFNGKRTKAVRVTYDAEVGKDTWYFYFETDTKEMIGYQFFYDEAKGDGEYIVLSDLAEVNGMKIPKNRAWFTNPDSTLLGTDHLISISPLAHSH
jgi:uncharacterized protein DUF6503